MSSSRSPPRRLRPKPAAAAGGRAITSTKNPSLRPPLASWLEKAGRRLEASAARVRSWRKGHARGCSRPTTKGGGAAPAPAAACAGGCHPESGPRCACAAHRGSAPVSGCWAATRRSNEQKIPLRGMRQAHLREHGAFGPNTPRLTSPMSTSAKRRALKARFARGIKPLRRRAGGSNFTYLPFIVKAVRCRAEEASGSQLRLRRVDERDGAQRKNYDIGIAAATEAGLVVPVLRNADRLSVLEIARGN